MHGGGGAVRPGDEERIHRLHRARGAIAHPPAVPYVVELAAASSTVRSKFGRPGRVRISRGAADAGRQVLVGELAHELAHLADPHERRDRVLAASALLPLVLWLVLIVSSLLDKAPASVALVASVAGWPLVGMAAWWFARVNGQVELRADRTAVQMLGSAEPIMAMIDRFEALDALRSRSHRFFARLTHPPPARRRFALGGLDGDQDPKS